MKKNKRANILLIFLCMFIIQAFWGCAASYTPKTSSRIGTQLAKINYIIDNFEKCQEKIKEESGFDGKIENGIIDGKEQKYVEFNIDDATTIKFVDNSMVVVTKQYQPSKDSNYTNTIEISLMSMKEDADVSISIDEQNGFISVNYQANDFDKPLNIGNEKYENNDLKIKAVLSTEELNKLTSTTHSIYKVFEEICKEYNESQKNK